MRIAHVAQIAMSPESGMGRVAWHWREAFAERGVEWIHVGSAEIGPCHPARFPGAAHRFVQRLSPPPDAVLVHEPAGAPFVRRRAPAFVFSHGLERAGWEVAVELDRAGIAPIRRRSRLLFPLWRLRGADRALRAADAVLAINSADGARVVARYGRRPEDVHLIRNGCDPVARLVGHDDRPTVLFLGSWIARKGTGLLVEAGAHLLKEHPDVHFVLAGTGADASTVLAQWPAATRPRIRVLPSFRHESERQLFEQAQIFVLPSYFEGQPLSLLQAMAHGLCCVVSDIAAHRDLVVDTQTGLLHAAGQSEALSRRLLLAVTRPELRSELGLRAAAAVADRGWGAAADDAVAFVLARLPPSGHRT